MHSSSISTWKCILVWLSILFSLSAYALDSKDIAVAKWTEDTLIETLSVDYRVQNKHLDKIRQHYTFNAWGAINSFLGNYMSTVQQNQLVLNPTPIGPPVIMKSGVVSNSHFFKGVPYWQIQQSIQVPELNMTIDFIAVVVEAEKKYYIQSLNMQVR